MTRRIVALASALLIALGLLAPTSGAEPEREDLTARVVLLTREVGRQFTTGNGQWIHERDVTATLAGTARIGTTDYTQQVTGDAIEKYRAADPTVGLGRIQFTTTLTPAGGSGEFTCRGILNGKRVPVPPPFPFAAEGQARAQCDNGLKWTADSLAQFELDPSTGAVIIVYYFTGEAR